MVYTNPRKAKRRISAPIPGQDVFGQRLRCLAGSQQGMRNGMTLTTGSFPQNPAALLPLGFIPPFAKWTCVKNTPIETWFSFKVTHHGFSAFLRVGPRRAAPRRFFCGERLRPRRLRSSTSRSAWRHWPSFSQALAAALKTMTLLSRARSSTRHRTEMRLK